jgi:hypothetical protein
MASSLSKKVNNKEPHDPVEVPKEGNRIPIKIRLQDFLVDY